MSKFVGEVQEFAWQVRAVGRNRRGSFYGIVLLKVLTEARDRASNRAAYWAVRAQVVQTAERLKFEQVPTYAPIHMAGHEGLGDFVFVPTGKRP